MEEKSALLPHILVTLSEKVGFCDTYENLCNEIKLVLSDKNVHNEKIEKSVENALKVGQNIGVLTWTDDRVRLPFKYNKTVNKQQTARKTLELEKDKTTVTQPRRTHPDMPSIRELGQGGRRRNVRRRSPKRISHRSRSRGTRRRSRSGRG